jgi:uncharacterized membrane protein YciS (DUF1049 family)
VESTLVGTVPSGAIKFMKTGQKLKYLVVFYLGLLVFLLLSVIAVPLAIQHEVTVTRDFIIEEDIFETALIVTLFGASCFILRIFKQTLNAHEREVNRAGDEKSRLISQMTAAFRYIGIVNVELHEIQSIFCGLEHYPQTKKEMNVLINSLAAKAMTIARAPWIVIRFIRRCDGQTIKEYAATRPLKAAPSVTMGNRAILEDRHVEGLMKIGSCQKNHDLMTVAILPAIHLSEEENILITAILNQIEIHFMLYHSGFLNQNFFNIDAEK